MYVADYTHKICLGGDRINPLYTEWYWKILSIWGMSGSVILIYLEKNGWTICK